jgi:hypothetical protein
VAGSSGPPHTAAFFKARVTRNVKFDVNNHAIKNFRDAHFMREGNTEPLVLETRDYELFKVLHPNAKTRFGFEFEFSNEKFHWSWFDFVSHLRDEDIDFLCDGDDPNVRSGGLREVSVFRTPDSYDHELHYADKKLAERDGLAPAFTRQQGETDFLFTRMDGSQIRLHPHHTTTKVDAKLVQPHPVALPSVLGGSEGAKCYQRQTKSKVYKILKIDGTKSGGFRARSTLTI